MSDEAAMDEHPARPRPAPTPRRIEPGDARQLSRVLTAAFDDDPVSLYLFPRARPKRLERYFAWQIEHVFLPKGEGWTTDDLAGASLWVPPRRTAPSLGVALRQLVAVGRILGRTTGRALALLDQLEAVHPKETHYYLATIGVDPTRQGCGIGSTLLEVVIEQLDSEGLPAYLECSKEDNIAFYHRHGFTVTGEVGRNRGGSPPIWTMWRKPAPPR